MPNLVFLKLSITIVLRKIFGRVPKFKTRVIMRANVPKSAKTKSRQYADN